MILAINKPYGVLSQFTQESPGQRTLAGFALPPKVYPIGRLDADSEGLLILGDEPEIVSRLLDPKNAHWRTYWVQVEGVPAQTAIHSLATGVTIQNRKTLPARAKSIEPPSLPPRTPPIRTRQSIPTAWLEIALTEGRNRQVRRMTAAVGHPTLRLFRIRIGNFTLPTDLPPGHWLPLTPEQRTELLS